VLTGLAARASLWNRRRKLALFLDELRPGPETTVVDVGVGDTGFDTEPGVAFGNNFFEAMYPWPERITAVSDVPLPNFAREFPQVACVTASGTDLPFEDDSFDIAFSNAVLEHVGAREEQRRFVHELCRVAARVFISTPNRRFPVEVHTLVPFLHWLPRRARDRAFGALRRDAWRGVELLSRRELLELFPAGAQARIVESRMTISAVAGRLSK
jgi:SAM-dependent methyltransferase